jgi:hypothetical protein
MEIAQTDALPYFVLSRLPYSVQRTTKGRLWGKLLRGLLWAESTACERQLSVVSGLNLQSAAER